MMSDFVEVEEEFEEEAEEEEEGQDERKKEPKKKVPLFKLQAKNSKNVSVHFEANQPWRHMLMTNMLVTSVIFVTLSASKNVTITLFALYLYFSFNIDVICIARQASKSQTSQHKANAWTRQTQSR